MTKMMVCMPKGARLTLDILARPTFYLFPNPSASLTPLLHETFTPSLLEQTACVILLDWSTPWKWLRELRDWISVVMRFLHETTKSSGKANEYERVINENIAQCKEISNCGIELRRIGYPRVFRKT